MKTNLIRSLFIALLVSILSVSIAMAHGEPAISVEPIAATPGGSITVTGSDWEEGEVLRITLESASGVFQLGQATATKDGEEGGFTATFMLASDLMPGTYLVRCVAEDGHTATADLTIATNANPMSPMEASAEPLVLDRSESLLLIGSVVVLALLSAGLGTWLIRMRE